MRRRALSVIVALLSFASFAGAQGFSLEIGGGFPPIHSLVIGPRTLDQYDLAEKGQEYREHAINPAFSISAVWRKTDDWELIATGGMTWNRYTIVQYKEFGFDPEGDPRYDLRDGHKIDSVTELVPSLTAQFRHIFNPQSTVQLYTAFGVGLSVQTKLLPLPSWTPVGIRFHGRHIYWYLESTLSPIASLSHVGVGYRF